MQKNNTDPKLLQNNCGSFLYLNVGIDKKMKI